MQRAVFELLFSISQKPANVLLKSSRSDRRGFIAKVCRADAIVVVVPYRWNRRLSFTCMHEVPVHHNYACLFLRQVADFGLSKIVQMAERGSLECDTDATGTIAYMAPEVLNGSLCPAAGQFCHRYVLLANRTEHAWCSTICSICTLQVGRLQWAPNGVLTDSVVCRYLLIRRDSVAAHYRRAALCRRTPRPHVGGRVHRRPAAGVARGCAPHGAQAR